MAVEACGLCEREVPFDETVHVLVHTHGESGVVDRYVCRACYERELEPVFE
ncbi:hypothetical protein HWV23_07000 [Natronomonas halophila]|uniref:hypothetical protein n=1 Tax=Natronomonas halophila TaxID=2747817 RepID=UPI0015B6E005|nr:hypothetical protein [Natronomonas halophila]QLD85482.1 hypothetical protein HWV23_07000 [Natronomonas halophila]